MARRETRDNLYLVGMMGAGKTTVGRSLARRLKLRFFDSDHEIEARCGVKIPVIFEIEGEAGFRAREAQAIAELTALDGIVLATGGGAVLAAGEPRAARGARHRGLPARYARAPVRARAPGPQPAAARRRRSARRGCASSTASATRCIARSPTWWSTPARQSVQVLARGLLEQLGTRWKRSA